jgi:hypothetical protein
LSASHACHHVLRNVIPIGICVEGLYLTQPGTEPQRLGNQPVPSHHNDQLTAAPSIVTSFFCHVVGRSGRSGDRIPVGQDFCAPVHTGQASCKIGTAPFPGNKPAEAWGYSPPSPTAEVKERVEPSFYSPSAPSWPLPLPYICSIMNCAIFSTGLLQPKFNTQFIFPEFLCRILITRWFKYDRD